MTAGKRGGRRLDEVDRVDKMDGRRRCYRACTARSSLSAPLQILPQPLFAKEGSKLPEPPPTPPCLSRRTNEARARRGERQALTLPSKPAEGQEGWGLAGRDARPYSKTAGKRRWEKAGRSGPRGQNGRAAPLLPGVHRSARPYKNLHQALLAKEGRKQTESGVRACTPVLPPPLLILGGGRGRSISSFLIPHSSFLIPHSVRGLPVVFGTKKPGFGPKRARYSCAAAGLC